MDKNALNKTDPEKVDQARTAFLLGLMDISWRLATVFLVPVIIGYAVDQAKNTSKYAMIGMIVGIILAVMFIIKQALDVSKKGASK